MNWMMLMMRRSLEQPGEPIIDTLTVALAEGLKMDFF